MEKIGFYDGVNKKFRAQGESETKIESDFEAEFKPNVESKPEIREREREGEIVEGLKDAVELLIEIKEVLGNFRKKASRINNKMEDLGKRLEGLERKMGIDLRKKPKNRIGFVQQEESK